MDEKTDSTAITPPLSDQKGNAQLPTCTNCVTMDGKRDAEAQSTLPRDGKGIRPPRFDERHEDKILIAILLTLLFPTLVIWTGSSRFFPLTRTNIAQISTAFFFAWTTFCLARGYAFELLAITTYTAVFAVLPVQIFARILSSTTTKDQSNIVIIICIVAIVLSVVATMAAFAWVCGRTMKMRDGGREHMTLVLCYQAIFVGSAIALFIHPSPNKKRLADDDWMSKLTTTSQTLQLFVEVLWSRKLREHGTNLWWDRIFGVWFWAMGVIMPPYVTVLGLWADWEWVETLCKSIIS